MSPTPSHRPRGFSLFEIVIVSAIVLILASVLVIYLNYSQDKTKYQTCVANVVLLSQQMDRYKQRSDFYASNIRQILYNAYGVTALPSCPSSYSAATGKPVATYTVVSDGYHYTLFCEGANHLKYLGPTMANFPQYVESTRLIQPQGR